MTGATENWFASESRASACGCAAALGWGKQIRNRGYSNPFEHVRVASAGLLYFPYIFNAGLVSVALPEINKTP